MSGALTRRPNGGLWPRTERPPHRSGPSRSGLSSSAEMCALATAITGKRVGLAVRVSEFSDAIGNSDTPTTESSQIPPLHQRQYSQGCKGSNWHLAPIGPGSFDPRGSLGSGSNGAEHIAQDKESWCEATNWTVHSLATRHGVVLSQ